MMRTIEPQSSRFTAPSWLRWTLIIIGVLFIIGFSFAIWIYIDVSQDRTAGEEEASRIALEETPLEQVENVTVYRGENKVHIVHGSSEDGDGLVYIDLENNKVIEQLFNQTIISEDELRQTLRQDCPGCDFKNIQLAYEESEPVYEITYIDEQNRYVFDYFKLSGESFNQRFAFKQNE